MLYTTTRNNRDAFTAHRALHENVAPDGGRFIPFRFPAYSLDDLHGMCTKSVNENIADILNVFFSAQLSGWDVDFCVGRNTVRLKAIAHKIAIAELWHNPGAKFDYIICSLYRKVTGDTTSELPSEWFQIAVRIAVYFAIYCDQCRCGQIALGDVVDLSVPADNCISLMAACYAKKMGLPVGMIVYTSADSSLLWDLNQRNAVATASISNEMLLGIERYLQYVAGYEAVSAWQDAAQNQRVFNIITDEENPVTPDTYCVVTGLQRCDQTINSVFRSNKYMIDPLAAVSFAGLQDYRTQSAASRTAFILAEFSPLLYTEKIAAVTGVSAEKVSQHIDI